MGITLASTMILGVGTAAFANTAHIDFDRVNLDAVEFDYASIVEMKRFKGPDIGTLDHLVETNSQGVKK